MTDSVDPVFGPGDLVKVRVDTPPRHIRTPWFIQGKVGEVEALYGAFKNPESLAYGGDGLKRMPLYRVRFKQSDVWPFYTGQDTDQICADLYQHWLKTAKE